MTHPDTGHLHPVEPYPFLPLLLPLLLLPLLLLLRAHVREVGVGAQGARLAEGGERAATREGAGGPRGAEAATGEHATGGAGEGGRGGGAGGGEAGARGDGAGDGGGAGDARCEAGREEAAAGPGAHGDSEFEDDGAGESLNNIQCSEIFTLRNENIHTVA